ncbi:hypothetical protein [Ancylobacter terrae]|uniref:hypothetical protein n=1 Tax=Ancylobacter sp. sgz301288 TaxID=3342077 RepID=UPI00385FA406
MLMAGASGERSLRRAEAVAAAPVEAHGGATHADDDDGEHYKYRIPAADSQSTAPRMIQMLAGLPLTLEECGGAGTEHVDSEHGKASIRPIVDRSR